MSEDLSDHSLRAFTAASAVDMMVQKPIALSNGIMVRVVHVK